MQNNASTTATLELPRLRARSLPGGPPTARFDLEFIVAEAFDADGAPAGLRGSVTVAADLFDLGTGGLITERLVRVLAAVAADPQARVHQVQVLDAAEWEQVLTGWNDTAAVVPVAGGVHDLIAARVAACPDAVAVVFGDGAVSYAGLDAAAARLAGVLAGRGAGPEALWVGVAAVVMERSSAGDRGAGRAQRWGGVPAGRPRVSVGPDRLHAC